MKWLVMAATLCAMGTRAEQVVDLSGDWKFRLDENKTGVTEKWFERQLAGDEKIKLPGTVDDAGLGPKNTKPPTLEGPYRLYDYAGQAWYQREIEIPESWRGKRVTLFLERCRWVTQVWLDGKPCGDSQDSLIAPHVHELGIGIAPGRHRLTMLVDNTVKLDMGRFVSAMFGGTWGNMNGVVGRIELNATPPVWIDEVQVYPDVAKRIARVVAKVRNSTGKDGKGRISVAGSWNLGRDRHLIAGLKTAFDWSAQGAYLNLNVELPADVPTWDEFTPALLNLDVALDAGDVGSDARHVVSGLRDFAANGTQFTMNGRPVFLRGTLECSIWPLTGYPPTDVESWRKIFQIEKSYGLNHIRFHSWCPPEAAFAAADIEGIMIQAEGPMANVPAGNNPARDAFIEAEFKRIVDTYGNHPSFCTMTLGNEYGGKSELLTGWVDMLLKRDPRHLYSSASSAQTTTNRQWTETAHGRGVHGDGTMRDLRGTVALDGRPHMGHEIGQWMFYPDFKEMKKWTGVMALKNYEMIRDDLTKKHMLDQAEDFVRASGPLAVLLYKEEIEVLLRTPGYAGFSLLDLHDYPTQGTALIGPLDAFWDSKGFIKPEEYRRFCGPVVPLLRIPKRTFTDAETVTGIVEVANFGRDTISNAIINCSIRSMDETTIFGTRNLSERQMVIPQGTCTTMGSVAFELDRNTTPAHCKFIVEVNLMGQHGDFTNQFRNEWEIWIYPRGPTPQLPADVIVSREWNDAAKAALADGKKVLLLPSKKAAANSLPGRLLPVFWSPVWFPSQKPNTMGILCDPKNPLFAQFPTEFHSNWQWWDLLNNSRSIILDDTPPDYRPMVQVIDNFERNHKLGNVFEARIGKGKLLVCAIDIEQKLDERIAARQFAKSLYAYLATDKFAPQRELDIATLDKLFGPPPVSSTLVKLGAKIVSTDSQHSGYEAEQAIDGDPNTIWHTAWEPSPKPMPHEIVIDTGSEVSIRGVKYLPRHDMTNGRIAEFEIYASADGKSWGVPVAKGNWKNNDQEQVAKFSATVKARFIRVVAKSEVKGNAFAAVAELDIVQ